MGIENDTEFEALCARLLPKFNEYLQRHSKNIFSCELATSLDGISTMPALYSKDGVQKQVIAPLSLLTKDVDIRIEEAKQATEEAKQATEEANTAAGKANDAAASVNKATTDLTAERKKVEDAVSASKSQTEAAKQATEATLSSKAAIESNEVKRQAAEQTRQSQEQARMDSETKRATAENARIAAENKRIDDTLTALTESEKQTNLAQELNDHPPKMGDNGNWWQWDLSKHTYVDTGVIARGGAMYPAFRQRRNKLLMIDYGSHVAEHVVKRRNKLVIKV